MLLRTRNNSSQPITKFNVCKFLLSSRHLLICIFLNIIISSCVDVKHIIHRANHFKREAHCLTAPLVAKPEVDVRVSLGILSRLSGTSGAVRKCVPRLKWFAHPPSYNISLSYICLKRFLQLIRSMSPFCFMKCISVIAHERSNRSCV